MTGAGDGGDRFETIATVLATVEMERILGALGQAPELVATAVRDPHLGAAVVMVETPDGLLAVAEPATEGRLAAWLARHGEGPAGRYAVVSGHASLRAFARSLRSSGAVTTAIAEGPFGPSILVLDGPPISAFLVLVDRGSLPSRR
jgi:hypothetical protein